MSLIYIKFFLLTKLTKLFFKSKFLFNFIEKKKK